MQRFQSHFNAWRNVSSEVVSCGINKIIGDARAGINDQQVCLRFQRYSADNGCQSVGSERLRRAVGHGDRRGGGSLHFEYGVGELLERFHEQGIFCGNGAECQSFGFLLLHHVEQMFGVCILEFLLSHESLPIK